MQKSPELTFIMPVGRAKYLQEAIESIQRQSYKKWELLIFDNIGIDITTNDERIKVYHTKGWSPAKCYNEGMKYASTDYILIASDDDIFFQDRALITKYHLDKGADIFAGSLIEGDEKCRPKKFLVIYYKYEIQRKYSNMLSLAFMGFKKNKVPKFRLNYKICHDYLFNLECGKKGLNIVTTNQPLGIKRVWKDSLYHSTPRVKINEELKRIRKELNDEGIRSNEVGK